MALTSVFSRYEGKKLLEKLAEEKLWLAILETEPSGSSTGATIKEAKWTGYEREELTGIGSSWETPTEGATCEMLNKATVTIPYTSGEGKVKWACLVDSKTVGAGNVRIIGELNEEFTVNSTKNPLRLEAGQLKFEIASS